MTDLRRYRRERERARRKPQGRTPSPREPLLGRRPRAGLILILVVLALAALWLLPRLH